MLACADPNTTARATIHQAQPTCRRGLPTCRLTYGKPAYNVNPSTAKAPEPCYAPAMIQPDVVLETAHLATAAWLRERGLDGVLIDVDDTLVASSGPANARLEPATATWLASLSAAGIAVVILSNGSKKRVTDLAQRLGVEALALSGKPFPWAFRRALKRLGVPAQRTAMIGDQLFTDVLGAKLAGITAILVKPLSPGKLPHTRLARVFERMCLEGGGRGSPVHR